MGATADLAALYYTSKPDRLEYKMTQMNVGSLPRARFSSADHVLVSPAGWFSTFFFFFFNVCCGRALESN